MIENILETFRVLFPVLFGVFCYHFPSYQINRQIQEYCFATGSWSTVGPLASALQEGPKPYSYLPDQQRGSPSWKHSKRPPRRQANRTAEPYSWFSRINIFYQVQFRSADVPP